MHPLTSGGCKNRVQWLFFAFNLCLECSCVHSFEFSGESISNHISDAAVLEQKDHKLVGGEHLFNPCVLALLYK